MDRQYWVWLSLALGAGYHRTPDILHHYPNPLDLYEQVLAAERAFGPLNQTEFLKLKTCPLDKARAVLQECARLGIQVVTMRDRLYPQRLLEIDLPPLALYVKGDISPLNHCLAITMVGTRRLTNYGYNVARRISYELAGNRVVVVSGMAVGGDAVCHAGALQAGGQTVAVLGCGIDVDYPKDNRELHRQIEQLGGLISEYPPGTTPVSGNFPVRNRILSGVSNGVLVVECGERSGCLSTAGCALNQGRDLFAVPSSVLGDGIGGTFLLLRDGAVPVRSAADVLAHYHVHAAEVRLEPETVLQERTAARRPAAPKQPPAAPAEADPHPAAPPNEAALAELSDKARELYQLLGDAPQSPEALQQQIGGSIAGVLALLTELELADLVRARQGRRYQRV